MKVVVVGAAGHVGLPFTLMLAPAFSDLVGLDLNQEAVDILNGGKTPFIELDAEEYLERFKPKFTTDDTVLRDADVIAIMIGTPVDEEGNPRIDGILRFMETKVAPLLGPKCDKLILLRSTVSPGTTKMLRDKLEAVTRLKDGTDFHLVFCPERVAQGDGINEGYKFPQLIGAFSDPGFKKAEAFFRRVLYPRVATLFRLTPIEAELAKLMTNMYRYINFALSNEFMMIAESHGSNATKIFEAANHGYPRMNIPMPGPNVGGPCLFKDGKFLLDGISYPELIRTSFDINEGMPDYIYTQLTELKESLFLRNVLILGAAFKANNDDTRNSLSFKMKKVLEKHGINVIIYDPLVKGYEATKEHYHYDAVIVMTPHTAFTNWLKENGTRLHNHAAIVDIWKLFPESQNFNNGIYKVGDYMYRYKSQEYMRKSAKLGMQGE